MYRNFHANGIKLSNEHPETVSARQLEFYRDLFKDLRLGASPIEPPPLPSDHRGARRGVLQGTTYLRPIDLQELQSTCQDPCGRRRAASGTAVRAHQSARGRPPPTPPPPPPRRSRASAPRSCFSGTPSSQSQGATSARAVRGSAMCRRQRRASPRAGAAARRELSAQARRFLSRTTDLQSRAESTP
jgi:hypothetical protein